MSTEQGRAVTPGAAILDGMPLLPAYVIDFRFDVLARHPDDPALRQLITELRSASPDFATWWDDHTVRERQHGRKRLNHVRHGTLTLHYDTLVSPDGSDQRLVVLTPADPTAEAALRTLVADHTHRLLHPDSRKAPTEVRASHVSQPTRRGDRI